MSQRLRCLHSEDCPWDNSLRYSRKYSHVMNLAHRIFNCSDIKVQNFVRTKERGASKAFKHASISLRSQSCRRKIKYCKVPEWKPDPLWLRCNGKETVDWAQVEDQMVRLRRDSEWKTERSIRYSLSSSFFFFHSLPLRAEYKDETDASASAENQLRLPIASVHNVGQLSPRDVTLDNNDRLIVKRVTYGGRWTRGLSFRHRSNLIRGYFRNIETLFPFGIS